MGWNSELLRITEAAVAPEINVGLEEMFWGKCCFQEECAFSIIHGDDYECLDLIALGPSDANIWVSN